MPENWLDLIHARYWCSVRCANLSQCLATAGMLEEAYRQGENIGWIKGWNAGWDDRELASKI